MKTKTGRTRRLKTIAASLATAGVAMAGMTGTAQAEAAYRVDVPCYGTYDGEWDWRYRVRPRNCMFNGDEAHAYTVTLHKMTWRTWGGRTACGHGYLRYNAGYRSRTSFCLYAKDDVNSYTRIRGRAGNRECSYGPSGYGCRDQKPFSWDSTTA